VLRVPPGDAKRVVSAQDLDSAVIRAGILSAGEQPEQPAADLSSCVGSTG